MRVWISFFCCLFQKGSVLNQNMMHAYIYFHFSLFLPFGAIVSPNSLHAGIVHWGLLKCFEANKEVEKALWCYWLLNRHWADFQDFIKLLSLVSFVLFSFGWGLTYVKVSSVFVTQLSVEIFLTVHKQLFPDNNSSDLSLVKLWSNLGSLKVVFGWSIRGSMRERGMGSESRRKIKSLKYQ